MAESKKDYTQALVVAGAIGTLGLGAWLMFRPKGAKGGDRITATFAFDYNGNGGTYILEVSLGKIWPEILGIGGFDHLDGMTWRREMELTEPGHYKEEIEFELPLATNPQTYDAEAGIRLLGSAQFDFVENGTVLIKGALLVEEKK